MAYDEALAARLRTLLAAEDGIEEKPMFGGLAFLVDGRLTVGASGAGGLMVRVPPDATDTLLDRPHTGPMIMRDRPVQGWLRVAAAGVATDTELAEWVTRALAYARSLPAKG